jgi:hypothetical protein
MLMDAWSQQLAALVLARVDRNDCDLLDAADLATQCSGKQHGSSARVSAF